MPIHWGAFVLALHSWDDPVIRAGNMAEELGLDMITPQIGEKIILPAPQVENGDWWKGLN